MRIRHDPTIMILRFMYILLPVLYNLFYGEHLLFLLCCGDQYCSVINKGRPAFKMMCSEYTYISFSLEENQVTAEEEIKLYFIENN